MPEIKTDGLTVKDVHDILSGKPFHRELTLEEKEQVETYKKSTEAFNQQFIESAKATLENSSSLSVIANAIKTVQSFSQNITPIIENQSRLVEAVQASISPLYDVIETVQNAGLAMSQAQERITATFEVIGNFSTNILEAVSSSTMNISKFFNNSFLHFPNFSNVFNAIQESGRRFRGIIDAISNMGSFFINTFKHIQEGMRIFLEPFFLLNKSNFLLILHASKGDAMALHQLGKLWWKLLVLYTEIEKRKGRKPTKKEFQGMVQVACWEVLQQSSEKQIPLFELAKVVYYFIIGKLLVDYVEIVSTTRLDENVSLEIVSERYRSKIVPYYDNQNKPNVFVKTVAEEIGVTAQTIRNWIKAGKVSSVRTSYYSKIRKALVPTYLLPYEVNLMSDLRRLKDEQESKKLHRLNGYFTISQLRKAYGLSRKTFERWDKEGKLVPKRINGIRYYTEQQKQAVPHILLQNNSPKIKSLLASPRFALG